MLCNRPDETAYHCVEEVYIRAKGRKLICLWSANNIAIVLIWYWLFFVKQMLFYVKPFSLNPEKADMFMNIYSPQTQRQCNRKYLCHDGAMNFVLLCVMEIYLYIFGMFSSQFCNGGY